MHTAPGTLRIAVSVRPVSVVTSSGTWRWDEGERAIALTELPSGAFDLAISLAAPLDAGRTADLLALPARKTVVSEILVGDEDSEGGRLLSGFSKPRMQAALRVYRSVKAPAATFRLTVPGDRPVWLKLRSARLPAADSPEFEGRLLMDGHEVGQLERGDALTFALPPDLTAAATPTERTFTLEIFPGPEPDPNAGDPLQLSGILLYAGPGVVDY